MAEKAAKKQPNRSLKRKIASRMAVINHLYAKHFEGENTKGLTIEALADRIMAEQKTRQTEKDDIFLGEVPERALLIDLLETVQARESTIRELIVSSMGEKWNPDRLGPLLDGILLTAVAEIMLKPDRSPSITINEYVSLTQMYFDEADIVGFVNGILSTIAQKQSA